jgi:hypothetical protein
VLAHIAEKQKELDMSRSAKAPRRRGQAAHLFKTVKISLDRTREFGFTGAVMRQRQQADHAATSLLLTFLGKQGLEGARICTAGEQLIAVDQVHERHGLLAQRMDDVMIVDNMAVLVAALGRPATLQRRELRCAEEAIEPELNVEVVTDQPRRHAVETRRRMKPPLDVTRTRASS